MKYALLIILTVVGCRNKITQPAFYPTPMDSIGHVAYPSDWSIATQVGGFGNDTITTFWATPSNGSTNFVITPKQDTVKVLMLVCDTMGYPHTSVGSVLPSSQAWNEGRMVWWMSGYIVYTPYGVNSMLPFYYDQIPNPICLDQNKKPLNKNLIVWMSKEIQQSTPVSKANIECEHTIVSSTMMDCNLPPCNTCTCQSCGKKWPCN